MAITENQCHWCGTGNFTSQCLCSPFQSASVPQCIKFLSWEPDNQSLGSQNLVKNCPYYMASCNLSTQEEEKDIFWTSLLARLILSVSTWFFERPCLLNKGKINPIIPYTKFGRPHRHKHICKHMSIYKYVWPHTGEYAYIQHIQVHTNILTQ